MVSPLFAAVILAASAPPAAKDRYEVRAFDPAGLDVATLKTLAERGTIIVVDADAKGKTELVTAGTIVDATPDTVYEVVTDYAHFAEFMPQVEGCSVVATREDGTRDVEFALRFKFSVITQRIRYTARFHTYVPGERVAFEFVGGDLKDGGGSYVMVPWEEGAKTLLFYSTVSDLKAMGFLTRTLLKEQPQMEPAIHASTASVVSAAVKKRAEALQATRTRVSGVRP